MLQWSLRVLIWLAVAVAINIAVAWGFAMRGMRNMSPPTSTAIAEWPEPAYTEPAWPAPQKQYLYEGTGATESYSSSSFADGRGHWGVSVESTGWPVRSLRSVVALAFVTSPPYRKSYGCFEFPYGKWQWMGNRNGLYLPLTPLWTGFALDSLVYSIPVGVAWMLPTWIRGLWRWLDRRCVRCGYCLQGLPIGESELTTCPECAGQSRVRQQKPRRCQLVPPWLERVRRIAKWSGAALTCLIAIPTVMDWCGYDVAWSRERAHQLAGVRHGEIYFHQSVEQHGLELGESMLTPMRPSPRRAFVELRSRAGSVGWWNWTARSEPGADVDLAAPTWVPLLVLAALTAQLWRAERRKGREKASPSAPPSAFAGTAPAREKA